MANTFALILTLATLVTGIIWAVNKFKIQPVSFVQRLFYFPRKNLINTLSIYCICWINHVATHKPGLI